MQIQEIHINYSVHESRFIDIETFRHSCQYGVALVSRID